MNFSNFLSFSHFYFNVLFTFMTSSQWREKLNLIIDSDSALETSKISVDGGKSHI